MEQGPTPTQRLQVDWLGEKDLERITIECLRIESGQPRNRWLAALYDAYAKIYIAAGASHGENGLVEEIPILIYEKALEKGWFSIPRRRPTRRIRARFTLLNTGQTSQGDDFIPPSECTQQFGTRMLPPWHVQQFLRALSRPIRAWVAEIREQRLNQAASSLEASAASDPPSVKLPSLLAPQSGSEVGPSSAKNSYSKTDAEIYESIGREDFLNMTNNEIAKAHRSKLRARFPRHGSESLRSCFKRIRKYHHFLSSEDVREKRSAKSTDPSGNQRSRRKKSGQ